MSQDQRMIGPGGGPTRATTLVDDPAGRKRQPVGTGVLDYFPDALVAVAEVSWAGNEQHNPGLSLRWTRGKSTDEADALIRHFLQRGLLDADGIRHSAKMAWRALALLQKEIEEAQGTPDREKLLDKIRDLQGSKPMPRWGEGQDTFKGPPKRPVASWSDGEGPDKGYDHFR